MLFVEASNSYFLAISQYKSENKLAMFCKCERISYQFCVISSSKVYSKAMFGAVMNF